VCSRVSIGKCLDAGRAARVPATHTDVPTDVDEMACNCVQRAFGKQGTLKCEYETLKTTERNL
jgi:hypothetical protein